MSYETPLCEELYRVLLYKPEISDYRLTFVPGKAEGNHHFLVHEEEGQIEAVCFKYTLLAVFEESHRILAQIHCGNFKDRSQIDVYISTLGFFLATPENRSALNLHEEAFYELLRLSDDFESLKLLKQEVAIVERLLTSTNNRLNKSSSLWCLYRKLLVLSEALNLKNPNFISVFIQSANRHISNYYCWNSVRWFFDVVSLKDKGRLFEATQAFCFKNIKDASSWSTLSYIVCQQSKKSCFNLTDCERLKKRIGSKASHVGTPDWLVLNVETAVMRIFSLIDTASAADWPPFHCILAIHNEFPKSVGPLIPTRWSEEIILFEKKHKTICLLRNNPLIPTEYADDLLISSNFRHLGYKKLLIQKLRNIKSKQHHSAVLT